MMLHRVAGNVRKPIASAGADILQVANPYSLGSPKTLLSYISLLSEKVPRDHITPLELQSLHEEWLTKNWKNKGQFQSFRAS